MNVSMNPSYLLCKHETKCPIGPFDQTIDVKFTHNKPILNYKIRKVFTWQEIMTF